MTKNVYRWGGTKYLRWGHRKSFCGIVEKNEGDEKLGEWVTKMLFGYGDQ